MEEVIEYWRFSTKIRDVYFVDNNGIKQGNHKHYYIDGELYDSSYFKDNLMHGVRYDYFKNKTLYNLNILKNGNGFGVCIYFDYR